LKNLRITMAMYCYSITSFVQRSEDGDAESLLYFDSLHASCSLSIFVMSLMYFLDSLEM
jgi:hypothetical protein